MFWCANQKSMKLSRLEISYDFNNYPVLHCTDISFGFVLGLLITISGSLLFLYIKCCFSRHNTCSAYRIVPNRSAVPNRRAPPSLKEKYAHFFLA